MSFLEIGTKRPFKKDSLVRLSWSSKSLKSMVFSILKASKSSSLSKCWDRVGSSEKKVSLLLSDNAF